MMPEQRMVDALLDRGQALNSTTDWTLMLPDEVGLLLPRDSDILVRTVDGQPGYYRTQAYRDCEVVTFPMTKPIAILSDSSGLSDALYLNLGTGQIGSSPADVGLPGA
jgi:hypothetical protein